MSLHDIGKDQLDRSNPMPNVHGHLIPESVKHVQTHSTSYALTKNTGTRIRYLNNMVIWYDDQNRAIKVEGFIPSLANYPVTITALYGYDVFVDILGISAP